MGGALVEGVFKLKYSRLERSLDNQFLFVYKAV